MSPLERLQADLYGRLEADDYFDDVGVFLLRPREQESFAQIQSRVDQALAGLVKRGGKAGAAVMVLMPTADAIDRNAPGPLLNFQIVVRVVELPVINMGTSGSLKSAEEIALRVHQLGHHFNPGRGGTLLSHPDALTPAADEKDDRRVVIDCRFELRGGVAAVGKVARPSITPAAGGSVPQSVTLACATAGAALWYTLDDSLPTPGNTAATLYSGAFNVSSAATLRVGAFATDLLPSDVAQAVFS